MIRRRPTGPVNRYRITFGVVGILLIALAPGELAMRARAQGPSSRGFTGETFLDQTRGGVCPCLVISRSSNRRSCGSKLGVLDEELVVKMGENKVGDVLDAGSRTYNGKIPGPTLRVQTGAKNHDPSSA